MDIENLNRDVETMERSQVNQPEVVPANVQVATTGVSQIRGSFFHEKVRNLRNLSERVGTEVQEISREATDKTRWEVVSRLGKLVTKTMVMGIKTLIGIRTETTPPADESRGATEATNSGTSIVMKVISKIAEITANTFLGLVGMAFLIPSIVGTAISVIVLYLHKRHQQAAEAQRKAEADLETGRQAITQNTDLQEQLARAQAQIAELESQATEAQREREAADTRASTAETQNREFESQITDLESKAETKDSEITELKSEAEELQSRITELESKAEAKETEHQSE
ncbi:MAG: hypothetical protein LBC11_03170, partial [Puniceicoccales bacterium]|nr:hypothetical protein [Puniceicoccales bacterium]